MAAAPPPKKESFVPGGFTIPDYQAELQSCARFLSEFRSDDDEMGESKYMQQLQSIANRDSETLDIHLDDISKVEVDDRLVMNIESNTKRYVKLFAMAADELMPLPTVDIQSKRNTLDIVSDFRVRTAQNLPVDSVDGAAENPEAQQQALAAGNKGMTSVPAELRRRYEVNIIPRSNQKEKSIRQIRASDLGGLVTVRGIVTRVTDVKPLVTVATYTCDMCGHEIYQPIDAKSYTPLQQCESAECKANKTNGKLFMQTRGSKFDKFQEVRIQELPDQVPVGHIPRSMTIHARGSCTRSCMPGDVVTVTGMFLPTPYTGYQAMRAGLTCDTYLQATMVRQHKKSYSELRLTEQIETDIIAARTEGEAQIYEKLSKSIAPEIFGMEDVKKALLLLLVGGADRVFDDGMKIRGDINVLLMGDPGVAKSQLLKHISTVAPRAVYTTGKGSSGVGLTASVMRDQLTNEVVLEGGALVLADMGICCIDEFDKMEETDRTAIYEVMEQQTVSIAKAGITTTLNARTSILAAANPAYGRYNKKRSPAANIDLPVALLSRFDLLFVLVDEVNIDNDTHLAEHVLHVHQFNEPRKLGFDPYSAEFMRAYISKARTFKPTVPAALTSQIINIYAELREKHNDEKQLFCTPRTLLSILRIAQAAARLRFSDQVSQADVDEAIRLFHAAKASTQISEEESRAQSNDFITPIFEIIRTACERSDSRKVKRSTIVNQTSKRGFSEAQLNITLELYRESNVLMTDDQHVWTVDN